jgi:transposase
VILEDGTNGLSGVMRELLGEMVERLRMLDDRLRQYDQRVTRICQQDERCRRLVKVEGVGPLVATALVAAIGNARQFKNGRELSAWLGLAPRQRSSGQRTVLLGITQAGRPLFAYAAHPRSTSGQPGGRAQTRRAKHLGEGA